MVMPEVYSTARLAFAAPPRSRRADDVAVFAILEGVMSASANMPEKLAVALMFKLLDQIIVSGANQTEALCALRGAEALLPEADLDGKPTRTVYLP